MDISQVYAADEIRITISVEEDAAVSFRDINEWFGRHDIAF